MNALDWIELSWIDIVLQIFIGILYLQICEVCVLLANHINMCLKFYCSVTVTFKLYYDE